ncbi:apolipoprotein N-acyltransferase [Tessaracoccus sp. G1721]
MISRPPLPVPASLALAVAAGLLIGAGQAPMGLWPATLVGVALFSWLMAGQRPRAVFGLGYVAGLAMNTLTVSWISVLGVGVGVALVAFLSLWWGVLGVAVSRLMRLRAWPLLVPAAWVAMEYLSGRIPFGGFSWARLGYTTVDQPMSGLFAWVGVAGVSYLVAAVGQLLLLAAVSRSHRIAAAAGAIAVFAIGALAHLSPHEQPTDSVTIAMVQPGVNRAEKGTGTYARSVTNNALSETVFALASARSDGEQLDFVLWPENATDVDPMADATTRGLVELSARLAGVPVFVGAVTDGPVPDSRQTSSIWWDPEDGPGDIYHKRDLVPFGEWIPFRDVLLPRLPILEQIGRQSIPGEGPGVVDAPTQTFQDLAVGTIICFELAYDDTSYDVVRGGAQVVVSQSNTNTYAGTFEPHQQLVINRVRAMELGREVAASTLNSLSAVIDTRGRVEAVTTEYDAGSLITTLPLRSNVNLSVTLNPWLAWAAFAATLVGLAAASGRRSAAPGSMATTETHQREVP